MSLLTSHFHMSNPAHFGLSLLGNETISAYRGKSSVHFFWSTGTGRMAGQKFMVYSLTQLTLSEDGE